MAISTILNSPPARTGMKWIILKMTLCFVILVLAFCFRIIVFSDLLKVFNIGEIGSRKTNRIGAISGMTESKNPDFERLGE
jgi:hypothetical protein